MDRADIRAAEVHGCEHKAFVNSELQLWNGGDNILLMLAWPQGGGRSNDSRILW